MRMGGVWNWLRILSNGFGVNGVQHLGSTRMYLRII
jgi:hypothetical protein